MKLLNFCTYPCERGFCSLKQELNIFLDFTLTYGAPGKYPYGDEFTVNRRDTRSAKPDFMDAVKILIDDTRLRRVLQHLLVAKVDYAKNTTRYTDIPKGEVQRCFERLFEMGLVDIYSNTSIKRRDAKLKRSAEVHKHHTYYQINRLGVRVVNAITPEALARFIEPDILTLLCGSTPPGVTDEKIEKLVNLGLMDKRRRVTELGKRVWTIAVKDHRIRCGAI